VPALRQVIERFSQVVAVNEAELFYDASCKPRGESDITLQVTLNRYGTDEEIGRQLGRLWFACLRWNSDLANPLEINLKD
jgi:hypothetical protein